MTHRCFLIIVNETSQVPINKGLGLYLVNDANKYSEAFNTS